MLELRGVRAGYAGHDVLRDVTLAMEPGMVLALVGPNGCGKSTLLRAAGGLLPVSAGQVLLDGVPIDSYQPRQAAQKVAYLPQSRPVPNITARRMVLHGRFPYLTYPRRYRREDYDVVREALAWVGASDLADCPLPQLSGGQRQRIYLAMALAQNTQTVLMDEPTTYLDIRHQLEAMVLTRRLAADGKAVVLVLHDLCLAMQYADVLAVMEDGRIVQIGLPEEVHAGGVIDRVMGVVLRRVDTPDGPRYYYLPKEEESHGVFPIFH